jgi:hypothetical protein
VRLAKDANGKPMGDEQAIIVGNRLGARGAISTAHLVSVEGRYSNDGFDFQGAGDDDFVRLVSLTSWSFACADEKQDFKRLLTNANRTPATLRLPPSSTAPQTDNEKYAEQCLQEGFVPLPHHLRQGGKTASFYHGPLVPGQNNTEIAKSGLSLPARAALWRCKASRTRSTFTSGSVSRRNNKSRTRSARLPLICRKIKPFNC